MSFVSSIDVDSIVSEIEALECDELGIENVDEYFADGDSDQEVVLFSGKSSTKRTRKVSRRDNYGRTDNAFDYPIYDFDDR